MGGHFDEKKYNLFKSCGEKMAITRLLLGLAPYNYLHSIENKIVVNTKLKRYTRLRKKIVVKIPALFSFLVGLKGLNF